MQNFENVFYTLRDEHDMLKDEFRRVAAAVEQLQRDKAELVNALNEEMVGRKRDAEDFRRRVLEQQHYFRDKINAVLQNREQVAESLRKAEGERHRYRVMYESTKHKTPISLGVENGRLKKKISQLQAQKRKWKRLHRIARMEMVQLNSDRSRSYALLFQQNTEIAEQATKDRDELGETLRKVTQLQDRVTGAENLAEYWRHQLVQRNAELATCRATLFSENKRMEELRRSKLKVNDGAPNPNSTEILNQLQLSKAVTELNKRVELLEERSKPSTDGGCW